MSTNLQFDVSALDRASATFTRLGRAVERFEKRLDEIDGRRVDAEIGVKTDKAEREIGRFARDMRRRLDSAIKSLPDIEIGADSSEADREIARIRGELQALADKRIGVDIDAAAAEAELARLNAELKGLNGKTANVQAKADTAAAIAALKVVDAEVDKLDGRTAKVKVDVDRSLTDSIIQVARLGAALRAIALPAAALAAAPQLAGIGAAAVAASGALGLLPAAGAAAGAAVATLAVGLQGLGDALKVRDDAKKFAEELKKLSPAAREFATTVRDLGPAWKNVQLDVQQKLLAGLGQELSELSGAYLPAVKTGLTGIAAELNTAAKGFSTFLQEARTVIDVGTIFDNTAKATKAFAPALTNIGKILRDIGTVGSSFLPQLAEGFARATDRAAAFIAHARETGQLAAWIQRGIDTVAQLGRILGDVGSIFGSVFRAADQAGVSFLDTVERITQGIRDFLNSAKGNAALVSFFTQIRATVDALAPGVQRLAEAVANVVQKLSNAGVLSGAASALSAIAQAAAPVLETLGSLASVVLPPLLAAARALAPVLVPIAAGLLAIKAASVGLSAISGFFDRLATSAGNAVVKVGTAAERMGASTRTVDRFASAGAKVESVLSRLGNALPYVGAALIALDAAYEGLTPDTEAWADALLKGQSSIAQVNAEITKHNATVTAVATGLDVWSAAMGETGASAQLLGDTFGGSMSEVRAQAEQAIAKMGPLEAATARVTLAQRDYDEAVRQFGPNSAEAAAKQRDLAAATDAAEAAQRGAAAATQSYSDKLRDQVSAATSALGANVALDDALARVTEAQKAANDAARQHGAASEEAASANRDLVGAILQAAEAAQRKAEADAKAAGATNAADVGAAAFASTLLNQAATLQGPARTAVLGYLATLSQAELDAYSAAAAASGFATKVLELPGGKTVTIAVDPETGKIVDTKTLIDSIQDKSVAITADVTKVAAQVQGGIDAAVGAVANALVPVDADTAPAAQKITQTVQLANGLTGKVTIDANPDPATGKINGTVSYAGTQIGTIQIDGNQTPVNGKIQATVTYIDGTTATMQLDANPALATGKITQTVQLGNGQTATMTLDANPSPADGKIHGTVALADGSTGTITIDGNPDPATGQIRAVVALGNGTPTTITINPRDLTSPVIRDLQRPTSSTHTIHVQVVGDTSGLYGDVGGIRRAAGAYAVPRAAGAYTSPAYMAGGGMRRMSAYRAEVVPARQPRVIGDRMAGDEAFIPINRSVRSRQILELTAHRMGYDLTRQTSGLGDRIRSAVSTATASHMRALPAASGQAAQVMLQLGPVVTQLRQLQATMLRTAPSNLDVVDELRQVRAAVLTLARGSAADSAHSARLAVELGEPWR